MKLCKPKTERKAMTRTTEVANLESETRSCFFSVETDFLPEDWDAVLADINESRETRRWDTFINRAAQLAVICPERRDELGITENDIRVIKFHISRNEFSKSCNFAEQFAVLFPERRDEFRNERNMQQLMLRKALDARKAGKWEKFFITAAQYIVVFPESRGELGLDKESFEQAVSIMNRSKEVEQWLFYAAQIYRIMLLYPDAKHELGIDERAEKGMMKQYKTWRGKPSIGVWASVLKVVAADRAEITKDGMELYYQEELEQASTLPERKIT